MSRKGSDARWRRRGLGLALVLALGAGIWFGCTDDPATPPLRPTGGLDNSCISDLEIIQVVGDFTEPQWTIPISPAMILGPGCVWTAVVRFASPGDHLFKLVTNGAFDNPQDFGWNESQALRVGVDNPVLRVSGQGTGIKLTIPVAGCYLFKLYEKDLLFRADPTSCATGGIRGRVEFENAAQPPYPGARVQALQAGVPVGSDSSATADGSFEVTGLPAGTYDVGYEAFGYLDTLVAGVQVASVPVDVPSVRLRAGCVSAHDSIQVAGQFTTPPFDLAVSPVMRQVEGCVWEATVPVAAAGTYLFKFVTPPGFDNPTDYGGDEAQTLQIDTSYPLQEVSGTGTAIKMQFPFPGSFRFVLDEGTRTFQVESGGISGDLSGVLVFEGRTARPLPAANARLLRGGTTVATAPSSTEDGTFRFAAVDAGVYDLAVTTPLRGPTHRDTTLAGVAVAGGTTSVGQVLLRAATGGLQGTVGFSNVAAPPYPLATTLVQQGGAIADSVVTQSASNTYLATGLKPGDYDVRVSAPGYIDSTFTVTVGGGVQVQGDVVLRALVCPGYPTITRIQLGGREINNSPDDLTFSWNLGQAPVLEHVEPCVWQVTVTAPNVADYRIKFICNGDFGGDPPDFGGDDTTVWPPDSTVAVVPVAAPSIGQAIRIHIENPGTYRFRLDLGGSTFSYTRTGDLPAALGRAVARAPRRERARSTK